MIHFFAGPYVERRAEEREAEDWIEQARRDPQTRYLLMCGTRALIESRGAEAAAVRFLAADDPRIAAATPDRLVLLGWFRGARSVLVQLEESIEPPLAEGESLAELRPFASRLPGHDAGLLAYARALAIWRDQHRYCGRCGARMEAARAGHALSCPDCGHESYPRIDPAIIVLVSDGERALLGRQPTWPPGRYSTIAGFVEPGESLEDAVWREVAEETGIEVQSVRYHSSQPWPFPSSLMLGFEALAAGGTPTARDGELEDVRWFTRAQVRAGEILLPPAESISRRLIEDWLAGDAH